MHIQLSHPHDMPSMCVWIYIYIYPYIYIYTYICIYTGFLKKKKKQPSTGNHIDTLPSPTTPTSMLWSEVPRIINRNGCFSWRPPNTKFTRQHELGDGGDTTSVVWYFIGSLFFFEEPGIHISMYIYICIYIYIHTPTYSICFSP